MIQSMTGYGKHITQLPQKKITVEIRTLNSKNLDLNMRLSHVYKSLELPLRKLAATQLLRGKVDVAIHVEKTGIEDTPQLNIPVISAYLEQLKTVPGSFQNDDAILLTAVTKFPDVFSNEQAELTEEEIDAINSTTQNALRGVVEFRTTEGATLEEEFKFRIANIAGLLEQVIATDEQRLAAIRTRLEKAVADIKENVDQNRFEQELIFYLEKYDITEEKVRLKNHLEYFVETMNAEFSQGKKLGFISQEIGREMNTIGSKANHVELQQIVVQMKDELEKIKEQLLNVL